MNTKEQIINESLNLFLKNGFDQTSINQISQKCVLTKGALYHHFKNKEEIFFSAIELFYKNLENWFENRFLNCLTIKDFIRVFFDYSDYFHVNSSNETYHNNSYRLIFDAINIYPQMREILISKFKSIDLTMQNKIKESQVSKSIKKNIDPEILSAEIFILFEGFLLVDIAFGDESLFKEKRATIFNNLWNRIKE